MGEFIAACIKAPEKARESTVTRLFGEMDTDLNFHRFVMKHIDATCDTRELRDVLVMSNARARPLANGTATS